MCRVFFVFPFVLTILLIVFVSQKEGGWEDDATAQRYKDTHEGCIGWSVSLHTGSLTRVNGAENAVKEPKEEAECASLASVLFHSRQSHDESFTDMETCHLIDDPSILSFLLSFYFYSYHPQPLIFSHLSSPLITPVNSSAQPLIFPASVSTRPFSDVHKRRKPQPRPPSLLACDTEALFGGRAP